jgi:hypothetical protein
MKRRRIKRTDVIAAIQHPGQVVPSIRGRQIYQSKIGRGGRLLLRVVTYEDAHAYHVVTAYKTTNVAKYWRGP